MTDTDDGLNTSKNAPSIGTLVSQLSEQVTRLVRAEIASAKAEMAAKAKATGIGIAMFVVGAVIALYGVGFLLYSIMAALDNVLPLWLAALILAVLLLGLTSTLVAVGVQLIKKASPATPEVTVQSVKDDIAAVKEGLQS